MRYTLEFDGKRDTYDILDAAPSEETKQRFRKIFDQADSITLSYLPLAPSTFQDMYPRNKDAAIAEAATSGFTTTVSCRAGGCIERASELLETLSQARKINDCPKLFEGGLQFNSRFNEQVLTTIYITIGGHCIQVGDDFYFVDSRKTRPLQAYFDRIIGLLGEKKLLGNTLKPAFDANTE